MITVLTTSSTFKRVEFQGEDGNVGLLGVAIMPKYPSTHVQQHGVSKMKRIFSEVERKGREPEIYDYVKHLYPSAKPPDETCMGVACFTSTSTKVY